MNKVKKYLYFLIFVVISNVAEAYVHNVTSKGLSIHWPSGTSLVEIYLNPENSLGLNSTIVSNIASSSANEWNNLSSINLQFGTTAGKNQEGLNEIYFSNEPSLFNGTGVVGVTLTSFRESDGVILSGDILLNDTYTMSTLVLNSNYIGNVITHELGHFLGLGHSPVAGSTMFYALSLGQNKVDDDDRSGLYSIYPNANSNKKNISGTIVGGKNLYKVFGAHVQAISVKDGIVKGAAVSDTNGIFKIMGLDINDKYFLYVSPLLQTKLPEFYSSIKYNFCDGGNSYRGSFFQACGGASEGYPQAIAISNSDVDVGKITIRCALDVPPDYFQKKSTSEADFNLISSTANGIGNSFVGYFSSSELLDSTSSDTFKIDLSSVQTNEWNAFSNNDLYIKLQILNQNFYSVFKPNVSYTQNLVTSIVSPNYVQNSDGWVNINTTVYLPIDKNTIGNNIYDIKVTPVAMSSLSYPSDIPFAKDDLFPAYSEFSDNLYFYLAHAQLVEFDGVKYSQVSSRTYQISSNNTCPDAANTYELTSFTTLGVSSKNERKSSGVSCGTIELDDDKPSSGSMNMLIGFSLVALIYITKRKISFI